MRSKIKWPLYVCLQHHLLQEVARIKCYCSSVKSSVGTSKILHYLFTVMFRPELNRISHLQFCACTNLSLHCTEICVNLAKQLLVWLENGAKSVLVLYFSSPYVTLSHYYTHVSVCFFVVNPWPHDSRILDFKQTTAPGTFH